MRRFALTLILLCSTLISVRAMSYEEAKQQAWFLTDKMAYELNLTTDQYDRAYEINLDYLMSVNTASDCLGSVWNYRDADMRCILLDWQYNLYRTIDYFFRPIRWMSGGWYYPIASHYRYGYYYFDCPSIFVTYRGGRWRQRRPADRSPYYGMRIERGYGMRDRYSNPRQADRPRNDSRYDRPWLQSGNNHRGGATPGNDQRPGNNHQGGNQGYQHDNNNHSSGNNQGFNPQNNNRHGSIGQEDRNNSNQQRNNSYQQRNNSNQQRNNSYQQRNNSNQQRNNSYQQRNNSNQQRNSSNQQGNYRNNRTSQQRSVGNSRSTMQSRPSRSVGNSSSSSRQSVTTPSRSSQRQNSTRSTSQSRTNNRSFSGR